MLRAYEAPGEECFVVLYQNAQLLAILRQKGMIYILETFCCSINSCCSISCSLYKVLSDTIAERYFSQFSINFKIVNYCYKFLIVYIHFTRLYVLF